MNILITGGSGFLGRALTQEIVENDLLGQNYSLTWVSRHTQLNSSSEVDVINYKDLAQTKQYFDIVINLAGAGIADKRWSDKQKKYLYASRLEPTQAVLHYIQRIDMKPRLLISASATGWYGVQDKELDEGSTPHDEFTHRLCDKWEKLACSATDFSVPVAIIRSGVVISSSGGMVGRLRLPFSLGLGGKLGNGMQFMSWISLTDWIRAVCFIMAQTFGEKENRIYNLTTPTPITNKEFTQAMGAWLKSPTVFSQPKILLENIFGEMSVLLLGNQQVLPRALLDDGFTFVHEDIVQALNASSVKGKHH